MIGLPEGYMIIKTADYERLLDRLAVLESKSNKNSGNSHKPPSSDNYKKKVKNNREASTKKPGAQSGHKGTTLKMVDSADRIIEHKVQGHCDCGVNLESLETVGIQRRQEIELPVKLIEVIEHRIEIKQCRCGKVHQGTCELKGSVQYGSKFKALMVYLNQYQFIPFERLQELSEAIFGVSVSDGLLASSNQKCYEQLEQTESAIKKALLQNAVIHNDETGLRCNDNTQWIHSTSTHRLTHYSLQSKRGNEGINAIGIMPDYKGISVHDRWASYDGYDCTHALCNAHLMRDLKFLHEEMGCGWALKMKKLLIQANNCKNKDLLDPMTIEQIELQYCQIIRQGFEEEPKQKVRTKPRRGRVGKSKSLRLLEVFKFRNHQVLLFMYHPQVPFDNNLAERDLRMIKLKQKISGCFRTKDGANVFCRIRSYISSARKQGYRILDAIECALLSKPVSLV